MEEKYMEIAVKEAEKAFKKGEVPVGAVIIKNNKVIAKAYNKVEKNKNATSHAEILAISKASKKMNNWRLNGCEMYVTLEPCEMCKSAIKLCRIDKVYFCIKKDKKINFESENYCHLNSKMKESLKLLQDFFKERR